MGFTATNVKNAEAAVKAATDALTEAGKVPAAREAGVAYAKARAGAGTQDWIPMPFIAKTVFWFIP